MVVKELKVNKHKTKSKIYEKIILPLFSRSVVPLSFLSYAKRVLVGPIPLERKQFSTRSTKQRKTIHDTNTIQINLIYRRNIKGHKIVLNRLVHLSSSHIIIVRGWDGGGCKTPLPIKELFLTVSKKFSTSMTLKSGNQICFEHYYIILF